MFGAWKDKPKDPAGQQPKSPSDGPGQPPQVVPDSPTDSVDDGPRHVIPDSDFAAAGQIEDMNNQLAELEGKLAEALRDRDHFQEKYMRTLADYQNSQKRASANERQAKTQGVRSVLSNILTVLDHFDLALGVDTSTATAQQVVDGVRVIRGDLMRTLSNHGVALIAPQAGDEFNPLQHQAVMQEQTEAVEPGRVVKTLQPGYSIDEQLVRPAMVSVRPA